MECLAILNRLSIFSSNDCERADLCAALERESETLLPADVPLAALESAVSLLAEHTADKAIVRCACAFLSSCTLGDSQAVRTFLYNLPKVGSPKDHLSPHLVTIVNEALLKCVIECEESSLSGWRGSVQPLTDLIATLSYNNGLFRAAFRETIVLLGRVLARARQEEQQKLVRGSSVRTEVVMPTTGDKNDMLSDPSVSLCYYTISCIAVLLMAESQNSSLALTEGVVAEILHCYKCVNTVGPIRSEQTSLGPVVRYAFAAGTAKKEINKWCVQAMRNAAIAAPNHVAWGSSLATADAGRCLEYGRMGDIIAVDELKWELSTLRRKYSS